MSPSPPLRPATEPTITAHSPAHAHTQAPPPRRTRQHSDDDPDEHMAKRLRASPLRPASHSSPSDDDSPDDRDFDIGPDGGAPTAAAAQSGMPSTSTSTAPPKKKRTRTLTTPHQSAVLHALLAQSRFPTTAMREEVGRSIGLSARKVQIWFQNQRQKSRRPRSQSDTPHAPFPADVPHLPLRAYDERYDERSRAYAPAPPPSAELPPLLGPGMPGAPAYALLPATALLSAPATGAPYRPPPAPAMGTYHTHRPRALSPPVYASPRMYPHPGVRPATAAAAASQGYAGGYAGHGGGSGYQAVQWRDPARTLPPLEYRRRSPVRERGYEREREYDVREYERESEEAVFAHHPPPAEGAAHHGAHRPMSGPRPPSSAHAHAHALVQGGHAHALVHGGHALAQHAPGTPAALPPPFTLEPPPQWDAAAFRAVPRPSSSAWSRPGSRRAEERPASAGLGLGLAGLGAGVLGWEREERERPGSRGGGGGFGGAGATATTTTTARTAAAATKSPTAAVDAPGSHARASPLRVSPHAARHSSAAAAAHRTVSPAAPSAPPAAHAHHAPSPPASRSPPPSRGRYDPVRAAFVAVHSPPSHGASPASGGGGAA